MSAEQTKKEALFNEVKGSLFEYLVAKGLARLSQDELLFQESLDRNYLTVLSQQDRMVRQFYPEMLPFLNEASQTMVDTLVSYFGEIPSRPRLTGKLINSSLAPELNEADLYITTSGGVVPLSLKLNKKNAFVNTKSGGIKSFFTQYFPFLESSIQEKFNKDVDLEFGIMAHELHRQHDLDFPGHFSLWVSEGFSELPGELEALDREVLRCYYSRLATQMHNILSHAHEVNPHEFGNSLGPLMGFSNSKMIQAICFHDFKAKGEIKGEIHSFREIHPSLTDASIRPFAQTSSVEIEIGNWILQIRIKPMNKFTTTAIKINCSVKTRPQLIFT